MSQCMYVGQRTQLVGFSSLLLPREFPGLNSSHRVGGWWLYPQSHFNGSASPPPFFFTFIEALGSVSSWEWLGSQSGRVCSD